MHELKFVKVYKYDEVLRKSFNELASTVFGISFECWYQKGYWTEKYVPFSYIYDDKVVANVLVNKLDLIINDEKMRSLQIGTVMTHPSYRISLVKRKLIFEAS
jgi:hypothetical protein